MKELKRYQEEAIKQLLVRTESLLAKKQEKKTIVFQSPTGSGKTFTMAHYIKELIEYYKSVETMEFCFLWLSIGKGALHVQSHESLRDTFDYFPKCHLLENEFHGGRTSIDKNEVVVCNWEKLRTKNNATGEWKNVLMRDSEQWNFREVIQNTREEGKTIILIIDESHTNATSERALEIRDEVINPHLTIEMSATPVFKEYQAKYQVEPNDVINEGMIKKEIIINEKIDRVQEDEKSSSEIVLESAYRKRLDLQKLYQKEKIDITPLALIQMPIGEAGEDKKAQVESFLAEKGITYENGKLAVWLSEEKMNNEKEWVIPLDSKVEFLIFKQAIDTGWDCPRAQVLVRFREAKSLVFEIQTLGRILRMPEGMHYKSDILNKSYVYTNVKSLTIKKEEYNPNIIKSIMVKRRDALYGNLKLRSYYRNRVDYGDVTNSFYDLLDKVFCEYFEIDSRDDFIIEKNKQKVAEKINIEGLDSKEEIILNKAIDSRYLEGITRKKIEGTTTSNLLEDTTLLNARLSDEDKGYVFKNLIKKNLNGFAPKRSIPTVSQAIYRWFKNYLGIKLTGGGIIYTLNVCLNNDKVFEQLIYEATRKYKLIKKKEVKDKIKEIEEWNEEWEISENRNLNPHQYQKIDNYQLSLYEPCHLQIDSKIEEEFIKFIEEKKKHVHWWWQNGNEHMALNFGIKYHKEIDLSASEYHNGSVSTFQPDFLVMLKNGQLGIFDTKASGDREDMNKLKAQALQSYIKEEKQKGKHLIGGIVIKEGSHFKINTKEKYSSYKNSQDNWEYLEDYFKP